MGKFIKIKRSWIAFDPASLKHFEVEDNNLILHFEDKRLEANFASNLEAKEAFLRLLEDLEKRG